MESIGLNSSLQHFLVEFEANIIFKRVNLLELKCLDQKCWIKSPKPN